MKVIALTAFIHGSAEFKHGEVVEMQEAFAKPLIKARLLDPVIDTGLQVDGYIDSEAPQIDTVAAGSYEPAAEAPQDKPKTAKPKAAA